MGMPHSEAYVEQILAPALNRGDIVIMERQHPQGRRSPIRRDGTV
jgi:hypothetical protein